MSDSLYREKSLERISSPDRLNDYIRVSTPGLWFVLLAVLILLAGALVWAVFGTIDIHTAEGVLEKVHPISFLLN